VSYLKIFNLSTLHNTRKMDMIETIVVIPTVMMDLNCCSRTARKWAILSVYITLNFLILLIIIVLIFRDEQ